MRRCAQARCWMSAELTNDIKGSIKGMLRLFLMSSFFPFVTSAIVADIPPPPFNHRPHSTEWWVCILIFGAICAAAFVGLRKLSRRRSKNSSPGPVEVTKE